MNKRVCAKRKERTTDGYMLITVPVYPTNGCRLEALQQERMKVYLTMVTSFHG
jgi:hypothetical protein